MRKSRSIYYIYIVGLTVMLFLLFSFHKSRTIINEYMPIIEASLKIRMEATVAHLRFEEIISGDRAEALDQVWDHLDKANWYANVMLEGGKDEKNVYLPLEDRSIRQAISDVQKELLAFRNIAEQRINNIKYSQTANKSAKILDAKFDDFLRMTTVQEEKLQYLLKKDMVQFNRNSIILISFVLLLTVLVGFLLSKLEKRRQKDISIIEDTNTMLNKEIIQHQQSKEALSNSYNLLNSIINTLPLRIFWKDTNLNYLGSNLAFANDAGENDPEGLIGKSDYDLVWKDQAKLYRADDRSVIETNTPKLLFGEILDRGDGTKSWFRTSKIPLYDDHHNIIGVLGFYEDITEQKLAETTLRESRERLQAIIENEPQCVKLINPRGELVEMNPAGLAMLQADTLEEAQQRPLSDYLLPEWRAPFIALHKEVMNGNSGILEFEIAGLKGKHRWLETHAVPMRDTDGQVTMLLGITRDITERRESEQHIHRLANFDALTGLPNRVKLDEQLTYLLNLSKRRKNSFSLMFLDIDNFKDINDTLGHNIGDGLLIELSKRITSILREEDTLARLGGDEFILLLPDTGEDGARHIAEKLLDSIRQPISIELYGLNVTASIGITMYPSDGRDKKTLFKNADSAMYRAKGMGRNCYSFFTKEMQTTSVRKLKLVNSLHHALSRNEFHIVYQPQISLETGHIIGAEALLRWEHPELGSISPAEFIPLAESTSLIIPIGEWVLRTASWQLQSWIKKGMRPIIMAVNLSAVQFRHVKFPEIVTQILEETTLPAEYLELELTEGVAMHNPQEAINIMNDLYERGIKISIDDFGTGYSSLSYLKKFKVYKLKIDQSFVRDINIDPEDKAIVSAIINMSHSLGLYTIAEGVETIEQLDYLHEQGCNEVQGYYFSKPLLPKKFEDIYKDTECFKLNL